MYTLFEFYKVNKTIICKEKKLRKTLILMLFVLSALFANTVHSVYAADLAAGEQVFSANCSACHAGGNNAIMPEKTLKKTLIMLLIMY